MNQNYQNWLVSEGYAENTCAAQIHRVQKVEAYYGSLDDAISSGKLHEIISSLSYSTADERNGRENPSLIPIKGKLRNGLQTYKDAVHRYARFVSEGFEPDRDELTSLIRSGPAEPEQSEKQRFALERDMQVALRRDISALESGLTIIDDGAERSVDSGFIDILCEDASGQMVVIELKAGKTDSRVVGQILGYMGDLIVEDEPEAIRGLIVAHSFDKRTLAAARAIPNLKLVTYAIEFSFEALP